MKLFQKVREIRSRAGVLHFERFAIFETSLLSLYVHRIYQADQDDHLHSHPWNFMTIVLWGVYMALGTAGRSRKGPLSFSSMTRKGFHKIDSILKGPVTTLFLAYGRRKQWYYLVDGMRVDSDTYRRIKHRYKT